ncbi:MAG TPA: asparaginase [Burkholderiaceae bacterium]|jgi:L-asparaginase
MQSTSSLVVVLGTGGTIAGTAANAGDNVGYSAAQIGAAGLVAAVPALAGLPIEVEQIAQLDSKNMGFAVWRALAEAVARHLARPEVAGIVITHGSDTVEETAYFLQRVLAPGKPVVLVAAMRPATALQADGPQNLLDAVSVARTAGACGVVAVLGGVVHGALDVRKRHPYRLDAFGSGDAGPIAQIEEGRLRRHRAWPSVQGGGLGLARLPRDVSAWPRVEIVMSHAGASGAMVRAACEAGAQGLVVATTGNGSVHHEMEAALLAAQAAGVAVLRSTRCLDGSIVEPAGSAPALASAGALTPVQARIELMLRLLAEGAR